MPNVDHHQFLSFELEFVAFEDFRGNELLRDLAREALFPETLDELGGDLLAYAFHDSGSRDRSSIRKSVQQQFEAEIVVPMGVGHIDRGQVLAACGYTASQRLRVFCGEEGVHKHRISFTINKTD